jgi:hypothetical protein
MTLDPDAGALAIHPFWRWFEVNRPSIERMIDNADEEGLGVVMSEGMAILSGLLGWEVGPGSAAAYQLSFTLKGQLGRLNVAEKVKSLAPKLFGWEFHAGRPPRQWDPTFSMSNSVGKHVVINAEHWRYTLIGYAGGEFYDITIVANGLSRLDPIAKRQAAAIVLQGLMGEVEFLRRIGNIDVIEDDRSVDDRSSEIQYLSEHLVELTKAVE